MTMLEVPEVPRREMVSGGPVRFVASGHHFAPAPDADVAKLADEAPGPLSVIVQVTRRCDFDCNFCSETLQMADPTLDQLDRIRVNLAGVSRVFLSGGEPLLRRDLGEIVDMYRQDFILAVPTNATRGMKMAKDLVGKVAFVNVGLEGPRSTTNRVRGDYDTVMSGIRAFQELGLPISLSCVVLRSTLHALPFTCQIGDVLDAGKVKMILPIRKGNGLRLADDEFLTLEEARQTFDRLVELRSVHGWRPALRMTAWTPDTEGHMIVVYPDGSAWAWPVYDEEEKVVRLGNVLEEPIGEIWKRYPFKVNHFRKYLGASIHTTG